MGTSSPPHITCAVFNELPEVLSPDVIHRFIVGEDDVPVALSDDDARATLGDPFAERVLLGDSPRPRTGSEILAALKEVARDEDALDQHRFFILGEGGQIAFSPATRRVRRSLRFVVACGKGDPTGPDVILSAFHPDQGDVELMAWDHRAKGFNFYRTVGASAAWIFAGNSRHALSDPTQGDGPFESHRSGAFLMKELRAPWIHWDSPDAHIQPTVFAAGGLGNHPWFQAKDNDQGAFTCEMEVARPCMRRWAKARFDAIAEAGEVADPRRIMEQILTSPAVNIVSSFKRGDVQSEPEPVDLPPTFFVDDEALREQLQIGPVPRFAVERRIYAQTLERFRVRVTDGGTFVRPGDTHFAFPVPERAFEDQVALDGARRIGLLSDRLAACLLMTDFPNPVFSARRAKLLEYVPETATISGGSSDFSDAMAQRILDSDAAEESGTAEAEFKQRWGAGESWREVFGGLLSDYHAAITQKLATQEGFDAIHELAESRRSVVRGMPIFENPLLFPESPGVEAATREMRGDGSVGTVATS